MTDKPTLNTSLALTGEDREPCAACLEKASELMIRRIEVKNGRVEIDAAVATDILLYFVGSAVAILDGATTGVRAENYVEMQCGCKELPGEVFTMTVQRPGGKTPHQALQEAKAENARLLSLLAEREADLAALREAKVWKRENLREWRVRNQPGTYDNAKDALDAYRAARSSGGNTK